MINFSDKIIGNLKVFGPFIFGLLGNVNRSLVIITHSYGLFKRKSKFW